MSNPWQIVITSESEISVEEPPAIVSSSQKNPTDYANCKRKEDQQPVGPIKINNNNNRTVEPPT